MGPMRLARTGQWVHTNPTGKPTPDSHRPHQDGIFGSKMKGTHLVLKREVVCTALRRLQTVERVGVGSEEIMYLIIDILFLMELGHFLVVHLTYLQLSSGPLLQFKKSALMTMQIHQKEVMLHLTKHSI